METHTKDLAQRKCIPCEGGIPNLSANEIAEIKMGISAEWQIIENRKLLRKFSFVNFKHTMAFVNEVARIAEEEGHHPVMHVNYGSVEIELWTHAINGLSENDFILAAKIDTIEL
ncbi:MAG TPA: 4a-hydroxytetrahydrobiopterin dehydratase [Bacteroidales bacterium]|nr:4a-hydroxytetrahydrobiopterin dehydratase [Bacteroidales bacterium]